MDRLDRNEILAACSGAIAFAQTGVEALCNNWFGYPGNPSRYHVLAINVGKDNVFYHPHIRLEVFDLVKDEVVVNDIKLFPDVRHMYQLNDRGYRGTNLGELNRLVMRVIKYDNKMAKKENKNDSE